MVWNALSGTKDSTARKKIPTLEDRSSVFWDALASLRIVSVCTIAVFSDLKECKQEVNQLHSEFCWYCCWEDFSMKFDYWLFWWYLRIEAHGLEGLIGKHCNYKINNIRNAVCIEQLTVTPVFLDADHTNSRQTVRNMMGTWVRNLKTGWLHTLTSKSRTTETEAVRCSCR